MGLKRPYKDSKPIKNYFQLNLELVKYMIYSNKENVDVCDDKVHGEQTEIIRREVERINFIFHSYILIIQKEELNFFYFLFSAWLLNMLPDMLWKSQWCASSVNPEHFALFKKN
jgi:hypothetical protein